ncbi:MAG: hypothetical protein JW797_10335 [Bradymonadales bacterium]|nr:hypothetical protein [Bradymonadales bacterium]
MYTTKPLALLVAAGLVGLLSCGLEPDILDSSRQASTLEETPEVTLCGKATSVDLVARRHSVVGEVIATNDEVNLYVEYSMQPGWGLEETHLALAVEVADLPLNRAGHPRVGHFPYRTHHRPPVDSFTYVVPLDSVAADGPGAVAGDLLVIAAHAAVVSFDRDDHHHHGHHRHRRHRDSAWATGYSVSGHSHVAVFDYPVQACQEPPGEPGPEWVTYTRAQWADVEGPAADWLDSYYDDGFSLVLGETGCGPMVRFTSAAAVREYLLLATGDIGGLYYDVESGGDPCDDEGGAWDEATQTCVDPLFTPGGELAGEIAALILNVTIDALYADFSGTAVLLGDMIYQDGVTPFLSPKPVDDILLFATYSITTICSAPAFDYLGVIQNINANYASGTTDLGYLVEPD